MGKSLSSWKKTSLDLKTWHVTIIFISGRSVGIADGISLDKKIANLIY